MNTIYSAFPKQLPNHTVARETTHSSDEHKPCGCSSTPTRVLADVGIGVTCSQFCCPGTCQDHPRSEISITTPMNWVNNKSGVKKDHTCHKATLKQSPAMMKVAVVMGIRVGYLTS